MKIKSLLLGSAAVLVAVSGARAADAVIIEAEPVEYVRICDAYGAGFFYIPGTETCLKIGGEVRSTYQGRHYHEEFDTGILDTHKHSWTYRASVEFDARNETEWGTLRSRIVIRGAAGDSGSDGDTYSAADTDPFDAPVTVDHALISLAGFRLGYAASYWTTHGGYGYDQAINDGFYSYQQGLLLDYTFAADGFTATIGIEDNRSSGIPGQPDLYVGADYSGAWGRVFGVAMYDSNGNGTVALPQHGDGGVAYKVGVELSLADYIPGGFLNAWYMADDGETDYVKGHTWAVYGHMDLADSWSLYAGYSDYDWSNSAEVWSVANDDSATQWTAGLRWAIAPGLRAQFEYSKTNYDYQIDTSRASVGAYTVRVVRSF